jgi:hypothetical protein
MELPLVIVNLLKRLIQPTETANAAGQRVLPVRPVAAGDAAMTSQAYGPPFDRWVALTDAYAEQFFRMQRGDKGAREKAIDLSHEMLRMKKALSCAA